MEDGLSVEGPEIPRLALEGRGVVLVDEGQPPARASDRLQHHVAPVGPGPAEAVALVGPEPDIPSGEDQPVGEAFRHGDVVRVIADEEVIAPAFLSEKDVGHGKEQDPGALEDPEGGVRGELLERGIGDVLGGPRQADHGRQEAPEIEGDRGEKDAEDEISDEAGGEGPQAPPRAKEERRQAGDDDGDEKRQDPGRRRDHVISSGAGPKGRPISWRGRR